MTTVLYPRCPRIRGRVGEFAGRQFGGVHLLDDQFLRIAHRLEIDAEALGPREQQAELFVEHEQGPALAARDRGSEIVQRNSDLPVPAGPISACSIRPWCRRRATDRVAAIPLCTDSSGESRAMIGGNQPREHHDAARFNGEVMIAAAKVLAAALDDAQAAPLAAIDRRQLYRDG